MRVGINGMGRIGRLALRAALRGLYRAAADPRAANRLDVVHLNEIAGTAETTAHLLEFDSVHGRWRADIQARHGDTITSDSQRLGFSSKSTPTGVPWAELGCELVLECTGRYLTGAQLAGYFARGVKKVVVAAPVKDGSAPNIVVGVNEHCYAPEHQHVLTAASCTTNCLAPAVKVLHDAIGIRHGQITTIHCPTNTNVMVDAAHKDLRRTRSSMLSLAPTTTASASAIGLIYPELKGKLNGHAVRAPVLNASLTDGVFEMTQAVTESEVNELFRSAAAGALAGILGFEMRPLVSVDYANDTRSAIVDGLRTLVEHSRQHRGCSWVVAVRRISQAIAGLLPRHATPLRPLTNSRM